MKEIPVPPGEISEIVSNSSESLKQLTGAKILIVGSTGFVGEWLTSALLMASQQFDLKVEMLVRDKINATNLFSGLSIRDCRIYTMDEVSSIRGVTHMVHSATPSVFKTGGNDMENVYQSTIDIGDVLFEIARRSSHAVLMHLSSGAVYGKQQLGNFPVTEKHKVAEEISDLYMKSKLNLEHNIEQQTKNELIKGTNPRLFAFAGPGIAVDAHFAIGNFMLQGLRGETISVKGNPETRRSYLHPVDMTTWLLAALANPSLETTHVGSEYGYSMQEIASFVADEFGVKAETSGNSETPATYYVPETSNTKRRLGVEETIRLPEAISRWRKWLESHPRSW